MTSIRVETLLAASPTEVWADIRDISSHAQWMHDAESIEITSSTSDGIGTTFDCRTRVGPIRLTDRMEITEWIEESSMGVRHVGLVTGEGRFTLEPLDDGHTRFVWAETLRFPWWMGGPLAGLAGGPVLRWIWRRNLRALAARFGS